MGTKILRVLGLVALAMLLSLSAGCVPCSTRGATRCDGTTVQACSGSGAGSSWEVTIDCKTTQPPTSCVQKPDAGAYCSAVLP